MPTGASHIALRLPKSAYLIVLFLLFGVIPVALVNTSASTLNGGSSFGSTGVALGWRLVFLLVPIGAAFYIARTATFVGPNGIRVRALLGSRSFSWDRIRGLSIVERAVYIVVEDGSVRLPCVRLANLHDIAEASDGRLPEVERHVPKPAPARRRRR